MPIDLTSQLIAISALALGCAVFVAVIAYIARGMK